MTNADDAPVVIQSTVTGSADPDPDRAPNLPLTPNAIPDDAVATWRAGAAARARRTRSSSRRSCASRGSTGREVASAEQGREVLALSGPGAASTPGRA
jgi:hypothetical protein